MKALENTLKQQDQLTVRKLGEKEENVSIIHFNLLLFL